MIWLGSTSPIRGLLFVKWSETPLSTTDLMAIGDVDYESTGSPPGTMKNI